MISFDNSWFLAKNLSNFATLPWKLHNQYCHIEGTDIYGNPYIYSFLNWKKDPLKSAMVSLGNVFVLFVLFLAYYFLAKFRDFFWARYVYDDAFDNQNARKISRVWRLIKRSVTIMCRNDELSWLFTNKFKATRYMKVKRMGIA